MGKEGGREGQSIKGIRNRKLTAFPFTARLFQSRKEVLASRILNLMMTAIVIKFTTSSTVEP